MKRLLLIISNLIILRVTGAVIWNYPRYLPPDFSAEFLVGREDYFFGSYQWAFYTHLIAGPPTLLIGLLLVNQRFLRRWPAWHRRLGKLQVMLVLFLLCPSGLWMAASAESGPVAETGFATLAIVTATCCIFGWRRAVQRKFKPHQQWMMRLWMLLCSAVVIRIIGGLSITLQLNGRHVYSVSAWISWLLPLAVYEVVRQERFKKRWNQSVTKLERALGQSA